ncbi:hypothetical protein F511_35423 [Dorcoceras hygrometricum]|uniref:Dystroglycan-like n=1 Tax=Dorcoceras hygrometricum TaxID=472368 RepID=A0A2Z7D6P8_9LAMI|nr:hypothetical protein F511_35423 [Dorcoceras hygrometricum]
MAYSLIANALQVNFDSVLGIPDNDGMVKMFRALESTGLRGFLGCPSVLYEEELEQFFDTALVKDNEILCVIHAKVVVITEDRFAGVFGLPTEGLTDLSEVPKNLVFDARSLFSMSGEPVKTFCKKREMKYEFRLLSDILAKSVTLKDGLFDAVTHERFVLMTAMHFELKVNWSKLLFDILKEMADKSSKRAKGYAAQICVLLKGDPAVTLGEVKTIPLLSAKTVSTYVATNKTIDARGESDEPEVAKIAVVKKKTVSKKQPAAASDAPIVKKKRTTTGRAAPTEKDLELVTVAQDVVLIQIVEPISAVKDIVLQSPNLSTSTDSHVLFTTGDIPLVDEIVVDQLLSSVLPAPDFIESLAQLRTSVTQLSIKQLRTQNSTGDLKNHLLSKIDHLEKAFAKSHTQQDQANHSFIKSVRQEVHTQNAALSIEMLEFNKDVRAQNAILITDVADVRNEVKDQKTNLSKEFDDQLASIHNDLLEFRVEIQEQYVTLRDNLAELIAIFKRGRDDKKGEVCSSQGRGSPPPDDRSRTGGGGGSRSEPVNRRGSGS